MKNNFSLILINLFILGFFSLQHAWAQNLTSNDLIQHTKKYDGKTVVYRGEAIGDVMGRGNFAWVNIHDGNNAIAIWVSSDLAKEIQFTGNYKTQGDILEVTGIFYRNCLEHGGDLDIHAQTLKKISAGRIVSYKIDLIKLKLIFILFGVLLLIWILTLFRRK
ncbi:MAG: DNA-binding protein [Candidatus Omnitrophota bacterium]